MSTGSKKENDLKLFAGVSSVAKGYSNYVDSMVDGKMSEAFTKAAGMDVRGTKSNVLTLSWYISGPTASSLRGFLFVWNNTFAFK